MSMNKGKAKAKPARKSGKSKGKTTAATAGIPKRAVMNRRKYNEAISGDTTGNYAMYKKGGTTKAKKYQAGKQVTTPTDSTRYYAEQSRQALQNMGPDKPGSEEAYRKARQAQLDYENRRNRTTYTRPSSGPRTVNKKGGTIKSKKK